MIYVIRYVEFRHANRITRIRWSNSYQLAKLYAMRVNENNLILKTTITKIEEIQTENDLRELYEKWSDFPDEYMRDKIRLVYSHDNKIVGITTSECVMRNFCSKRKKYLVIMLSREMKRMKCLCQFIRSRDIRTKIEEVASKQLQPQFIDKNRLVIEHGDVVGCYKLT